MAKFMGMFRSEGSTSKKDTSIVDFIIGLILIAIGLYNIFKNTSIGVLWMSKLFGLNLPSGVVTIPILIGIVLIFMKPRMALGWIIIAIGVVILLVQIIMSVKITFNTTSLWNYFLMFGGTFGGLGLLGRALLR